RSTSIPHLQATHCKISSVLPVNAPETRDLYVPPRFLLWPATELREASCGRISGASTTRAAQVESLGRFEPGGNVWRGSQPPELSPNLMACPPEADASDTSATLSDLMLFSASILI